MKIILIVWLIINIIAGFVKLGVGIFDNDKSQFFHLLPVSYCIITNKNKNIAIRIFLGVLFQLLFLPCDIFIWVAGIILLFFISIIMFLIYIILGEKQ